MGLKELLCQMCQPTPSKELYRFDLVVDGLLRFAQAGGPEGFPREELWVLQHETPEFDVVTVDRAGTFAGGEDKFLELEEACLRAAGIDATGACFGVTEFAEAGGFRMRVVG